MKSSRSEKNSIEIENVYINLVNKKGIRIGAIDKLEAHKQGKLHEAFSILIFNKNRELLIQRRALNKYHSGGLWTNTCCSHPKVNEELKAAVRRRLKEEMGFNCNLKKIDSVIYKTKKLNNNLIEYEFDHIFIGNTKKEIPILANKNEVCEYKWIKISDLKNKIRTNPQNFTEWFKIIIKIPFFQK